MEGTVQAFARRLKKNQNVRSSGLYLNPRPPEYYQLLRLGVFIDCFRTQISVVLTNCKPLSTFALRGLPFVSGTRVWTCRSQATPLPPRFLPTPCWTWSMTYHRRIELNIDLRCIDLFSPHCVPVHSAGRLLAFGKSTSPVWGQICWKYLCVQSQ